MTRRTSPPTNAARRNSSAAASSSSALPAKPARSRRRRCSARSRKGSGAARIMSVRRCCRSRKRPKPARSTGADEIAAARRHRARRGPCRACRRRAARQCARAHERLAGASDLEGRASTRSRSAPPRAARSPPKRSCSSTRPAAPTCQERRKRGGHLVSKHRFIAAQIEAYLADDLWLRLARHANAMADRLRERACRRGSSPGLAGGSERGVRRAAFAGRRAAQGRGRELLSLDDRCAAARRHPGAAMPRSCASSPRLPRLRHEVDHFVAATRAS